MNIDILTLFPEMFKSVFSESIICRAQKKGLIKIKTHQLRDWAKDKHKTTDDTPYGGGAGMVMKVDVIDRAIASLRLKINPSRLARAEAEDQRPKIILLTPQGQTFTQKKAQTLVSYSNLLLICGHYEGIDERVRYLVDEQISIGNYVLTGGEIPAMVLIDTISRLIPGVLAKNDSSKIESFSMENFIKNKFTTSYKPATSSASPYSNHDESQGGLKAKSLYEFPQYTRPFSYKPISKKYKKSLNVPKILITGNHQKIYQWRIKKSYQKSIRGN